MSESKNFYGGNTALLSAFPEELRPTLHLIEKNAPKDAAQELLGLVASAAHPDYVTNLAGLAMLPPGHRAAAAEFVKYVLATGLSTVEQRKLLDFAEPRIAALGPGGH